MAGKYTLLFFLVAAGQLRADEPVRWLTGEPFHQQLASPTGFLWSGNPLRPAVTNLARSQRVAVFLDRRIDPGQRMDLSIRDQPLAQALDELADSLQAQTSLLEPVVYLGPPKMANALATLAANRRDDAGRLPPAQRSRWQRRSKWSWQRLATPRRLLRQLADELDCQIVNLELVPHDLWPAVDLPPLSGSDRCSLLLANFSLTFDLSDDGTELSLLRAPDHVVRQQYHRPPGDVQQSLRTLAEEFPQVTVQRVGRRLQVTGRYEDHQAIARLLQGETRPRTPHGDRESEKARKRYSMRLQDQPAEVFVNSLAKHLQLTVETTPNAAERLRQRVSFHVTEAKLDELLHAALDPVGVRYRLAGDKLTLHTDD